MLKTLVIAENPYVPSSYVYLETEDVLATLAEYFDVWPQHARLYHHNVANSNDVTPNSEEEIAAVSKLEGTFYAVNYPGDPITIAAFVVVALVAVAAIVLRPKIPVSTQRNIQSTSPNNALSGRTNQIRINGRIPDIFGTVRSTPDLISVPYSVFENNIEIEYCYMCIGRGTYAIGPDDCRDGQTAISKILGESLEIFGPNTSPNTGDAPQLRIGDPITRPVIEALRSKSVNGQTLLAPNDGGYNSYSDTFNFGVDPTNTFYYVFRDGSEPDFSAIPVIVGDQFQVTTSAYSDTDANHNSTTGYVGGDSGPPAGTWLFGQADADSVQSLSVRFYTDGRIEFAVPWPGVLNDYGYGYLTLTTPLISDGTHTANLTGRYVVSSASTTVLQAIYPTDSSLDWSNIAAFTGGVTPYVTASFAFPSPLIINVSGTYTADLTVASNELEMTPAGSSRINNDWVLFRHLNTYHQIENRHAILGPAGLDGWIGPFVLDIDTTSEIIANYVAASGIYKDDGTTQTGTTVDIQLGAVLCNEAGDPLGVEQFFTLPMTGSSVKRSTVAQTLFADVMPPGRYAVRSRRLTPKDLTFNGQISDEIKWRDCYSSSPVGNIAFGDITTAHCVTHATDQALAVSERQINMLVTRKIPLRVSGSTFTADLHATNKAEEIISFVCLDPKIGNRKKTEVNFDQIYNTLNDVRTYFGSTDAAEFCYTIDSDNVSFEETLAMIADAVFCSAHRRGIVIELNFEKETDDSVLLFTHRNKVPGSETRTLTFGNANDNDGIEYDYVNPADDSIKTFYVPIDRSAVNPLKIQSVGVRNLNQAQLHAWRIYQKLIYQSCALEMEVTQEADILALNDRILVADNTRPDTQDGDIMAQSGMGLTLSQPAVLKTGVAYIISLQLPSGIVENIAITPGVDPYNVTLGTAPTETLVSDDSKTARTVYTIVRLEDQTRDAFLVNAKDYNSNFTCNIKALNYDARYYQHDLDFYDPIFDPVAMFHDGIGGGFYDFTDSATLFSDTGRAVPAVLGGLVQSVTDKSGNGRHLVKGGANDVICHEGFITFQGDSDMPAILGSVNTYGSDAGWFIMAGFRPVSNTESYNECIVGMDWSVANRFAQAIYNYNGVAYTLTFNFDYTNNANQTGGTISTSAFNTVEVLRTPTQETLSVNGSSVATSARSKLSRVIPVGTLVVGADGQGTDTPRGFFKGDMLGVIFLNRVPTTDEIAGLRQWFALRS